MNEIRVYRRFYIITTVGGVQQYNLLDPFALTASSIDVSSNSAIEGSVSITQESAGFYYASLNPSLYYGATIYEINWKVVYLNGQSQKNLYTRFKLSEAFGASVGNQIETSVDAQQPLIIEINKDSNLEYEIFI